VRARGAWFGDRSISAEVNLDVGTYEVLPKIEASQDADAPDVPEVVTKLAERNPQKLRQIGLNYDIANAKGVFELTEEEQKKKEKNKKDAAEKKKKAKEAEEKEKTDFEAWKQEDKAEYEAWKKEKERKEKNRPKQEAPKPEDEVKDGEVQTDTSAAAPTAEAVEQETPTSPTAASTRPEVIIGLTVEAKDSAADNEPSVKDATDPTIEPKEPSDAEEADLTPNDEDALPQGRFPRPPQSVASRYGRYPGSVYGDVPPPPPVQRTAVKEEPRPWNAVCVLGLRVYSQDPEVRIKLVKPKDVEEGAILDVDGDTPAGATM
jgi:hypothetical protein